MRYDPFNASTAHVFVKGQWTECHSEHYADFAAGPRRRSGSQARNSEEPGSVMRSSSR